MELNDHGQQAFAMTMYFFAAVVFAGAGLLIWTQPLPRERKFIEAGVAFSVISLCNGCTLIFGRSIRVIDAAETDRVDPYRTDHVDWLYADHVSEMWLLFHTATSSITGFRKWVRWTPVVILAALFAPSLIFVSHAAYVALACAVPLFTTGALLHRELGPSGRRRHRGLYGVGIPLLAVRAALIAVFSDHTADNVGYMGLSVIRLVDVMFAAEWWSFWVQSETEYMQCWNPCACCCLRCGSAVITIETETTDAVAAPVVAV
jgi:hypothetical protein